MILSYFVIDVYVVKKIYLFNFTESNLICHSDIKCIFRREVMYPVGLIDRSVIVDIRVVT